MIKLNLNVARLALCTLIAGAVCSVPVSAQDAPHDKELQGNSSEDPFAVPDGDVEAMFAFMKRVQQAPPPESVKTREGFEDFLRNKVEAVLKACDRVDTLDPDDNAQVQVIRQRIGAWTALSQIDKDAPQAMAAYLAALASDERPEVRKIVSFEKITSNVRQFGDLTAEQYEQLAKDVCHHVDTFGFDQTSLPLCDQLAQAFGNTGSPQHGAMLYDRLVALLKEADNPQLKPQIVRYEGSARRLRLPGNFMEVMGTTADGKDFDWAAYRGKVVLVDFWATWCGPCRQQIPNMKAQLEKYGDKGFAIVGISLDNTMEQYQAFIDSEELTWVNLMSQNESERGWDHPLVGHYGISGIPAAFLVDQEGVVVSMAAVGPELNRLLDEMLGDQVEVE